MKKYLAIYYAPAEAMEQFMNASQEQKLEGLKGWHAWKDRINDRLINFGAPLMPGNAKAPNQPWSQSSREVTGFSIVQAENVTAAKTLFDGHVHLASHPKASIEVHEFAPM